ncbi:MAG: STAS domain-containing protein [Clostridia bacterium]|nr:STAS domain-containing protein [Clostridia bacterium]
MNEVQIKGIEDGNLTIELFGDIDSGNAENFYLAVVDAYKATPADLLFDCKGLDFIDSTTLGTFVKILKTVKTDGYKMKLVNLQAKIKKLFVICSLNTIMEIA